MHSSRRIPGALHILSLRIGPVFQPRAAARIRFTHEQKLGKPFRPPERIRCRNYLRLTVKDRAGNVTQITDQERQILARWRALVEAPILDMAYSWGSQKTDVALETATDLKGVFSLHNRAPNLR